MFNGAAWQNAPTFLAMAEPLKLALVLFVVAMFALFTAAWQNGKRFIACVIVILAALVVFFFAAKADARDDGRYAGSPLKPWFDSLKSGKGPCCSDADGYALSDVDWESKSGHYRVRIEGEWYDVPDDAVITEPNRAGRTMVWPIKGWGGLTIRCFMPGPMG